MNRVLKTTFSASKRELNRLFECNRLSAKIWNTVLELAKNYHLETGKWITKSQLQKQTKKRFPLHSQSEKGVLENTIYV